MKIGFFSDSYFPEVDGVTYTLESWKKRLERRGHEVFIIYPGSPDYDPGGNEIPVKSVPNPFYSGYRIPTPVFRRNYPDLDIVHCQSPAFLGVSGLRYSRKKDVPAIYTHHTPVEEYFEQSIRPGFLARFLKRFYPKLETFLLRKFDILTASTESPRRNLEFKKLPVGVDMEFFSPSEKNFFEDIEDLERPLVGYSGRLSSEKNPLQLLKMAKEFEGTLIVVGEGPLKKKVEKNKPENVISMDFIDRGDLPSFYSSLDVFVTASTGDTLGLSTLEANSCGTPVVAPDVFPFNKTMEDQNGILYEKENLEDFRSKILEAYEKDSDTREVVRRYSLSSAIDELEDIYFNLLK